MKKMAFVIICMFVIAACTKTKTVTVQLPPVHDTTTITINDTTKIHDTAAFAAHLVGSWKDNIPSHLEPTFSLDSLTWSGTTTQTYRYVASGDTLFHVYSDQNIYPEYTYTLSKYADTLMLYPLHPLTSIPYVYWRY